MDETDLDVNSGGVVLLPDQSGQYPHLLIQVGKEGTIDLINRDNMGHWDEDNDDQIVQTLPSQVGGVFGGEAFWNNTPTSAEASRHWKHSPSIRRPSSS